MSDSKKHIKLLIKNPELFLNEKQLLELYKNLDTYFKKPKLEGDRILVSTDGACSRNNKKCSTSKAGYGVFFGDGDKRNKYGKIVGSKITNNVAELTAIVKALQIIKKHPGKYTIVSDSQYSINSITKWAKGWKKKGWKKRDGKTVENLELIKTAHGLYESLDVNFKHVRSHQKEPSNKKSVEYTLWYMNSKADDYAVRGSQL